MNFVRWISILALVALITALSSLTALAASLTLPPGVAVGNISGPGQERMMKALKAYIPRGATTSYLNGQLSIVRQVHPERETVIVRRPSGPPELVYQPDDFTKRLWLTEKTPMTDQLESYDLKRFTGLLVFDWQLVSTHNGAAVEQGRVELDVDRISGGFLASVGLAPPLKQSAAMEAQGDKRLAEELVRHLILQLGRVPSASEIEVGDDSLSRQAKSLAAAGQWDEARKLWENLLKLNPKYAPPLYNMGLYFELRRNPEQAWHMYRAAFINDGSARHREALTRMTETLSQAGRLPSRNSSQW